MNIEHRKTSNKVYMSIMRKKCINICILSLVLILNLYSNIYSEQHMPDVTTPELPNHIEIPRINIPDEQLRKAIGKELEKKDIIINSDDSTLSLFEIANVTSLNAQSKKIKDLKGLNKCTNLKRLILSDNQISDIESLRDLTSLAYLDLSNNQISDIEPLCNLTSLTYLD